VVEKWRTMPRVGLCMEEVAPVAQLSRSRAVEALAAMMQRRVSSPNSENPCTASGQAPQAPRELLPSRESPTNVCRDFLSPCSSGWLSIGNY
jgi:hypothetical protein